jgi:lactoylglutathione lyase
MKEWSGRAAVAATGVLAILVLQAAAVAQPAAPRPRITGISHVALRVSDATAARAFYRGMLGLSEDARPGGRLAFTVGAHQEVRLEPGLPAGEDERLRHVAFATPDAEGLKVYLAARGLQPTQPPDRCEESAIHVADPDGHTIEFVHRPWPPSPGSGRGSGGALSARLLHAGLIVRDEAAAHAMYRDVLGLSEIWRGGSREGITSWVNMRLPEGTDYIEYMLQAGTVDRRQRGVLHHVCLRVPDIQEAWDTVAARAAAAGQKPPSPPTVGRNGKWQLNLYDPDGTRVELMEPFTTR